MKALILFAALASSGAASAQDVRPPPCNAHHLFAR
jgi:hypothetical protein